MSGFRTMTNKEHMTRCFFALPAHGVQEALGPVYGDLNRFSRALKTVEPENYHITLKFLGVTGESALARLRDDFRALDPGVRAIPFTLHGLGAFPDVRRARVVWCGLDLDRAVVERVRLLIENLADKHGFRKEARPFQPHLTLARVKKEMRLPPECAEFVTARKDTVFGKSAFDRIVLFKSELRKEGPLYTVLEEKVLS